MDTNSGNRLSVDERIQKYLLERRDKTDKTVKTDIEPDNEWLFWNLGRDCE